MTENKSRSIYRTEIDGLRAIAVLGVVLNHGFPELIPGGFAGVDVFFVISGFLITRILLSDIDNNKFSIAKFYAARARRLLPALLAFLFGCSVAAYFIFTPNDFRDYARSLISTATFTANFHFHGETGYFAPSSKTLPLLHMWSLAVEEQFYLLFPLFLLLFRRVNHTNTLLLATLAASLVLAQLAVHNDPDEAFYYPYYRFWEFATGAIIASRSFSVASKALTNTVSLLGVTLIVLSYFTIDANTAFPGITAAPATVGAAMVIVAGSNSWAGRALSLRPAVAIGLVSYSLYLWHWPIIVFAEYFKGSELSYAEVAALLLLATCFAVASWKWIEQPFRRPAKQSVSGKLRPFRLYSSMA